MNKVSKIKKLLKDPINEFRIKRYRYSLKRSKSSEDYLKIKFNMLKNVKSDINEHMNTLSSYASKVETIFETGVRGVVSSWAFLEGLKRNQLKVKKLFLNDVEECDLSEIIPIANELEIDLEYEWGNNLSLNISDNYDLIFIDTWHVYAQLKRELQKFSNISNQYIILHDTTIDGELGESIRHGWDTEKQSKETGFPKEEIEKGLWPAVEEFLIENKDWVLENRYFNCNGLTILKRFNIKQTMN